MNQDINITVNQKWNFRIWKYSLELSLVAVRSRNYDAIIVVDYLLSTGHKAYNDIYIS